MAATVDCDGKFGDVEGGIPFRFLIVTLLIDEDDSPIRGGEGDFVGVAWAREERLGDLGEGDSSSLGEVIVLSIDGDPEVAFGLDLVGDLGLEGVPFLGLRRVAGVGFRTSPRSIGAAAMGLSVKEASLIWTCSASRLGAFG